LVSPGFATRTNGNGLVANKKNSAFYKNYQENTNEWIQQEAHRDGQQILK